MVSTHTLFEWLVGLHIATGTVGLIVVWIPIAGKKGGALHRRAGTLFVQSMIATGFTAIAISLTTLSDPTGTHPVDFIAASEYGEILRLDPSGRIVAAYPMPSAVPSWIVTTDDAVLAGRIGDGGLPDSTLVRIKRSSLSAEVVVIPAPFDGSTEWPPDWVTATSSQVDTYNESIGFAPDGAQGTPATSWIGEVVVDIDRLNAIADAAFGQ